MMHHAHEGVIVKFLPGDVVEVEIEDGFKIPVLRAELVAIAKEEKVVFSERRTAKGNEPIMPSVAAESGFFMAFVPVNDRTLLLYLVNNTDIDILFTLGEAKEANYMGIAAGHLPKRSTQKVHETQIDKFEKWSPMLVQALFFRQGYTSLKEPLLRKITFSANTFFKSKRPAPLLGKDAYLFQIDQKIESVDPLKIKEAMTEKVAEKAPELPKKIQLPPKKRFVEIDLHIEQLTPHANKMNSAQMIELQINTFEKQLDKCILEAVEEVTFIHGVGNGVLRSEIQKRLSQHPHVAYYQDARKERFGYGATTAKLK